MAERLLAYKMDNGVQHFLPGVFSAWSDKDLLGAANKFNEIPPSHPCYEKICCEIAYNFADNQPERGLSWLNNIKDRDAKDAATKAFVRRWVYNDVDSATDWVNSLPDNSQREAAAEAVAQNVSIRNPELALEWASTLRDKEKQESLIWSIYNTWKRKSPDEASEWLKNTKFISSKIRKKLR